MGGLSLIQKAILQHLQQNGGVDLCGSISKKLFNKYRKELTVLNRQKTWSASFSRSMRRLERRNLIKRPNEWRELIILVKMHDKCLYAAAWINKAHNLYNKGKCDEAIKAYDNAIEIDPQYAKSSKFALDWHNKARTLYNKGKYDEAIKAYDNAIEIDPQYAKFPEYLLAWIYKAHAHYNEGKYDEAIKAYDKAIEIYPQNTVIWNHKALSLANNGKYDEAIKAYDNAIELDPQNADIWNNKGAALLFLGRRSEAHVAFAKAKKLWGIRANPSF